MTITPQTKSWLRQSAAVNGAAYSQVLLNLLERVEALEQRPIPGFVDLAVPAPEAAPVVTDGQILAMRSWSSHGPTFDSDLVGFGRACYDLGRQHGAAQPPAAQPASPVAGELSIKEVEAQDAFTQMRNEVLSLSDGVEVNEVLGIIDNHTPEWV